MKPGLTGWAQVKYRYGSSVEDAMEKLRYDLYYIKHLSVFFDLTIVFDTVKVMLFRKGRRSDRTAHRRRDVGRGRADSSPSCAQRVDAVSRHPVDAIVGLVMLPFNLAHLGAGGVRVVGADGVAHRVLLDARSRLWRRAGAVRRAVPGASATRAR